MRFLVRPIQQYRLLVHVPHPTVESHQLFSFSAPGSRINIIYYYVLSDATILMRSVSCLDRVRSHTPTNNIIFALSRRIFPFFRGVFESRYTRYYISACFKFNTCFFTICLLLLLHHIVHKYYSNART